MKMNKHTAAAVKANKKLGVETIQLEPTKSLDQAIIGHKTYKKDGLTRLIYGFRQLVRAYMKHDGMTEEEACDWVSYNTQRAIPYMAGPKMAEPVIHAGR